jgi:hypothetical protein
MTRWRSDPMALAAASAWAAGAWCASGAITSTAADATSRLGALAPWWLLALLLVAALALALALRLTARDAAPLWVPLVCLLPWLPLPLPAAALLWVGPPGQWLAGGAAVAAIVTGIQRFPAGYGVGRDRASVSAVVTLAALFAVSAWWIAPRIPGGDEPHYLIITQSLLNDGDLRIEDNHQRREYAAYVEGTLRPDYLRRGRDGAIYSIHAPGVSALVLPAFAAGGYPGVVLLLSLLSAAGLAAIGRAAEFVAPTLAPGHRVPGDLFASTVATMAVGLSAPFFFQSMTVYPDGPAAVAVAAVVWLALARPEALSWRTALACGVLLGALPWLHTRYAAIAGPLGLVVAARVLWPRGPAPRPAGGRARVLAALLLPAAMSAAAWVAMFQAIYGTWDPRAPYGHATDMRLARIPDGIAGLLLDQQFGLLPNAPIYLVAIAGMIPLWRRDRRLAAEIAILVVPYLLAVAGFHMWWGGRSSPVRFLVPVLLPLALPVAAWWAEYRGRTARAVTIALLAVSVAQTAAFVLVDHGRLIYNSRDGHALWLLAASAPVNLTYALPSLFQGSPADAWRLAGAWLAVFLTGVAGLRWLSRRADLGPWRAGVLGATALIVSGGASLGWGLSNGVAVDRGAGALSVLAHGCEPRARAVTTRPAGVIRARDALRAITIDDASRRPRRPEGPAWSGFDVPPGRYAVTLVSGLNVTGAVAIAFGRPDTVLARCTFADQAPGPTGCEIPLPAGASALWVTGDASIARTAERVALTLVEPGPAGGCGMRAGRAAVRDGRALFVADGQAWVEGAGLWTAGGGEVTLVASAINGRAGLHVRQGSAAGEVGVRSGSWSESRTLDAGATWDLQIPQGPSGTAMRVTVSTAAGFRPADADPASSDVRWLGAWIEPR